MRALKLFLIIMGVVIVAGYIYLGYEVVRRATNPQASTATTTAATLPATGTAAGIGLDLPPGARIAEMLAVGNHLVFRVTLPDGGDRIYTLDPRSGTLSAPLFTGKPPTAPSTTP